jgi:tripartite-type tricarboxylate transporter receptor subunit TctC
MRHAARFAAVAVLVAAAVSAVATGATPAPYPTRPVRLVVPFPPGGGADTLARIVAPRMTEALGQTWVVDNRSGAAGNIAVEIVAKAAPDGYTVLLTLNSVLTMNPGLYGDLPFDVQRDLQPLTQLSSGMYVFLLHPSVPAATVKELLDHSRTKPAGLSYASAGVGSPLHLATELLKSRTGAHLVHIPYKGGGPAVVATIAGEAQVTFASIAASIQHVRNGRMKAIAVTGTRRAKAMPELPTMEEAGFPGFVFTSWHALLAPARTPEAVVARLHREALAVARQTAVREAMTREGMETTTGAPLDLARLIRSETAVWRDVIRTANIRAQ